MPILRCGYSLEKGTRRKGEGQKLADCRSKGGCACKKTSGRFPPASRLLCSFLWWGREEVRDELGSKPAVLISRRKKTQGWVKGPRRGDLSLGWTEAFLREVGERNGHEHGDDRRQMRIICCKSRRGIITEFSGLYLPKIDEQG